MLSIPLPEGAPRASRAVADHVADQLAGYGARVAPHVDGGFVVSISGPDARAFVLSHTTRRVEVPGAYGAVVVLAEWARVVVLATGTAKQWREARLLAAEHVADMKRAERRSGRVW
jgi:hypothetical protein